MKKFTALVFSGLLSLSACTNWVSGIPNGESSEYATNSSFFSLEETSDESEATLSMDSSTSLEVESVESNEKESSCAEMPIEIGIRYQLSDEADYYIVTGVEGISQVEIFTEYKGLPVKEIAAGAFAYTEITELWIEEGVQKVGASAFRGCNLLSCVTIGVGLVEMGDNAFGGCSSLTEILLPSSLEKIGAGAFAGCTQLTGVNMSRDYDWVVGEWNISKEALADKTLAADYLVGRQDFEGINLSTMAWKRSERKVF